MINTIHLGNFKAFAETQAIPVKPITLIFGANSAGKSSIIHSLALLHEALHTGELDIFRTKIGGSSIDLGGFRQYIHRRQAHRRLDFRLALNAQKFQGRLKELLGPAAEITTCVNIGMPLDDQDQPKPGATPHVVSYELESDGDTLLRMSRRPAGHYALDQLSYRHPVILKIITALLKGFTTITSDLTEDDIANLEDPIADIIADLRASMGAFFPKGLKDHSKKDKPKTRQLSLFPVSKGYRHEDLAKALRFFLPRTLDEIIREISTLIESEIDRMQYLGPLRSYPPRHIAFSENEDHNWLAGGGYAWDVVRRDSGVRNKVNSWLGDKDLLSTPYELSIKNLLTIDDLEADYDQIISKLEEDFTTENEDGYGGDLFGYLYADVMQKIKEQEGNLANIQELILIDRRTDTQVSHRDVGIGISQVMPILVSAYASKNEIIAIEQPEIHLHPKLQAELGDLFISSALNGNGNKFILETHSEHLILRILRRIREATRQQNGGRPKICPDDIALLYIDGTPKGSTVQELRVDERGRLIDQCPGGFFEEDFEELF
jgi:predicted ATPase